MIRAVLVFATVLATGPILAMYTLKQASPENTAVMKKASSVTAFAVVNGVEYPFTVDGFDLLNPLVVYRGYTVTASADALLTIKESGAIFGYIISLKEINAQLQKISTLPTDFVIGEFKKEVTIYGIAAPAVAPTSISYKAEKIFLTTYLLEKTAENQDFPPYCTPVQYRGKAYGLIDKQPYDEANWFTNTFGTLPWNKLGKIDKSQDCEWSFYKDYRTGKNFNILGPLVVFSEVLTKIELLNSAVVL